MSDRIIPIQVQAELDAMIDEAGKVCARHGLTHIAPTKVYHVAQVLLKMEAEIERLQEKVGELTDELKSVRDSADDEIAELMYPPSD